MKCCIREMLRTAMMNAYYNPKQIIMSDRMRKLSNLILRDLCKVICVNIPTRKETSMFFKLWLNNET